MRRPLQLGHTRRLDGRGGESPLALAPHHLTTHGVVLGMTGSGKTGLLMVMVEEALRSRIPVLMIDVKGDLPNLTLALPSFEPGALEPWVELDAGLDGDAQRAAARAAAEKLAAERKTGLEGWGVSLDDLAAFAKSTHVRVLTPGADAGELLHVLSSLERRSPRWDTDRDGARGALSASISLVLRLLGRDPDPARSREHVLLSVLAERRLVAGQTAELAALLDDLLEPPIDDVGALPVDEFLSKTKRKDLAASLNALLAAPTFASWREGATLDVGAWMAPVGPERKTPATIVSVAHLDDDERALVLGVVLDEVLTWVRGLSGARGLRALVVFDEVYGFLPPHPAAPPTKRPLVALLKQARAYGVGVVVATQNPMDLDYRVLGNAGLWCLGRLQTDADRERVIEGLAGDSGKSQSEDELSSVIKRLSPRWFVMRDAHSGHGSVLLHPRWAMSFPRGPMTRGEIRRARGAPASPPAPLHGRGEGSSIVPSASLSPPLSSPPLHGRGEGAGG